MTLCDLCKKQTKVRYATKKGWACDNCNDKQSLR